MCGIVGYIGTEQAAPIILDPQQEYDVRKHELKRFLETQNVPYQQIGVSLRVEECTVLVV